MSYKSDSQFVWVKWMLLIGLVGGCVALGYIIWWSFLQTRAWFVFLDFEPKGLMSLSLAVIFQYGQGPVLYLRSIFVVRRMQLEVALRRKTKGTIEYALTEHDLKIAKWSVWGLAVLFVLFGAIDAMTNIGQMWAGLDVKKLGGEVIGSDKYLFTGLFGIVVVLLEEVLGVAFSLASHTANDILEIHGYKRIKWLDVFADNAQSLLSGGGDNHKKGGGGGGYQGGGTSSYRPNPNASSFKGGGVGNNQSYYAQPAPKPSPGSSFEPSYHTPQVRAQDEMFKIND